MSKAIEFGLTPVGILKKGEVEPSVYHADYKAPIPSLNPDRSILRAPSWLSDAVHLLHTTRGLNYQFSEGVRIPSPTRPQTPTSAFLVATLYSIFTKFIVMDLLESTGRFWLPQASREDGFTIFDPSLPIYPVPWRYIVSTAVVLWTAFIAEAGLNVQGH